MSSPPHETVEKARARVLEMLSDPGMMGGDGIGVEEVDALISAVRQEGASQAQRTRESVLRKIHDKRQQLEARCVFTSL